MEKFEIFEGKKYRLVNVNDYIIQHKNNLFGGIKTAKVNAVKGRVGQEVITGERSKSIVSYDSVTGEPDWIITQPSNKKMVILDSVFKKLYKKTTKDNEFEPTLLPRLFLMVSENIAFMSPWGEMNYIEKNGIVSILAGNDIYGITKEEFKKNYKKISFNDMDSLLEQTLATTHGSNKPKVFISVANPHTSSIDQEFMRDCLKYLNSMGLQTINVKQTDKTSNLLREIARTLEQCQGILSLAFNRDSGHTSPFIHIEASLAQVEGLTNLTLLPKDVHAEGMLYHNNNNIVNIDTSKSLFDTENSTALTNLNQFIDEVIKSFSLNLKNLDLIQFKPSISSRETQEKLTNFLKAFYQVGNLDFSIKNVFVKRHREVHAYVVKKDGDYTTKDGLAHLKKGDYIILTNEELPYAIQEKEFSLRYKKVRGSKNLFTTKLSPVKVAKGSNGKIEVTPLINPSDTYQVDAQEFMSSYIGLISHIKSIQNHSDTFNYNELSL